MFGMNHNDLRGFVWNMKVDHMRYIETRTRECGARLHATTEPKLKSKVASSRQPQHRGYPDEVGFVPHIVVDPEHNDQTDPDSNLCSDSDPKRATVFSACLGLPHLPIDQTNRDTALQHILDSANCNLNDVLDRSDDTVRTILHERERLRMRAVRDDHPHALDDETTLTADPVDQILLTCARAAERRHGEVTAEGVRQVLSFKRTSLHTKLPFAREQITETFLSDRLDGKTCAPLLPECEAHQQVLLYYIDNPDASVQAVVDETGINRGRFETFRLLLPDPRCYDREHIANFNFDTQECVRSLREWMEHSSHPVYACSECEFWTYSKQGLAIHKSKSTEHTTTAVTADECPTKKTTKTLPKDGTANYGETTDVETMLTVYAESTGDTTVSGEGGSEQTNAESVTVDTPQSLDNDPENEIQTGETNTFNTDNSEPGSETTPEGSSQTQDTDADITGRDIVAQTNTPLADIAEALLMSEAEVVDTLLDELDDADRASLRSQFEHIPETTDAGNSPFDDLQRRSDVSTL